jgi:hypothetical protein
VRPFNTGIRRRRRAGAASFPVRLGQALRAQQGITLVMAVGVLGAFTVIGATPLQAIGPIIGSTVYLGQSTATSFPSLTVAPAGMPGSPMVYAQPNPPQLYSG